MIKLRDLLLESPNIPVYTGSDVAFVKFDLSKIGTRTDIGFAGKGAYTTINKEKAQRWGKYVMTTLIDPNDKWLYITSLTQLGMPGMSKDILNLPQPKRKIWWSAMVTKWTEQKIKEGYEGVEWKLSNDTQYVLFRPDKYNWSSITN